MNIPKGYKLVPVELLESLLDDPALVVRMSSDKIMAIKGAMLDAAPATPQPIYDESKELALFEASIGPTLAQRGAKGGYLYVSTRNAWSGWIACAQSRAKAGEVGHE